MKRIIFAVVILLSIFTYSIYESHIISERLDLLTEITELAASDIKKSDLLEKKWMIIEKTFSVTVNNEKYSDLDLAIKSLKYFEGAEYRKKCINIQLLIGELKDNYSISLKNIL